LTGQVVRFLSQRDGATPARLAGRGLLPASLSRGRCLVLGHPRSWSVRCTGWPSWGKVGGA